MGLGKVETLCFSRRKGISLSELSHIPLTSDLGCYLGAPILHGRVTKSTYNGLIDEVRKKRLSGWKADHLSMAGRTTLVQSITSSLPVYLMQTTRLPEVVCNKIDQLNRNFLWGSTEEKRRLHLVNWQKLSLPRDYGGINVREAKKSNIALPLLAKLGWKIWIGNKNLWAEVLRKKYLRNQSFLSG